MKNTLKKIFALMLCAVLCLGMMPAASATEWVVGENIILQSNPTEGGSLTAGEISEGKLPLTVSTNDGYTFTGITVTPEDMTETTIPAQDGITDYTVTLAEYDQATKLTFTANFTQDQDDTPVQPAQHGIAYQLNGGAWVDSYTAPETYTEGEVLALPTDENLVAPYGYTFVGWYTDADFTTSAITEIADTTTGDVGVFAKWDALDGYNDLSLTLEANADCPATITIVDGNSKTTAYTLTGGESKTETLRVFGDVSLTLSGMGNAVCDVHSMVGTSISNTTAAKDGASFTIAGNAQVSLLVRKIAQPDIPYTENDFVPIAPSTTPAPTDVPTVEVVPSVPTTAPTAAPDITLTPMPSNPKTGDDANLWLWIGLGGTALLVIVFILVRRAREN